MKEIAGIDIFTDETKTDVKSMPKLLDELNAKWDTLNGTQKKALSNAIAGKTQADVFNSLMNNYDTYQKMMGEFANNQHIGGAMKEKQYSPYV